jgi:tetratricopeptide (TPR) repeat protein
MSGFAILAIVRVLALVAALVCLAAPARAESPLEVEAKAHFSSAQKLFDAARYAEALDEYGKSYELSRYPAILYRIALCQDLLGRRADAIASYQRYLDADPATARRDQVIARMKELTASTPPPAVDRPPAEALPVAPPPQQPVYTPPSSPGAPQAEVTSAPRRGRVPKLVAGAILMAGGAVLVGVGGVFSAQAIDSANTLNRAFASGGTVNYDPALMKADADGHSAVIAEGVLYAVGGAALVGGVVLVALGARADRAPRVSLAPLPGGGAISWQGRF